MTRARMGWLFLAAMGCGSKKETVETLPATIKYELVLNNAPESRHGPIRYAIRIGDQEYDLKGEKGPMVEVELPSSVSILKQPAAILIKGTCKTASVPTTGGYLPGNVTDDASEKRYLTKETKEGKAVPVYFDVAKDAVKPLMPLQFPTRLYVDRGDATTVLRIGDRELPRDEHAPVVTPDCDGLPVSIGDRQVSTYRAAAEDFAKSNPGKDGDTASSASLFVALDPAACYTHSVKFYGTVAVADDKPRILRGGAAHVIGSAEVAFFLKPSTEKVTEAASLSAVSKDEILRAPCPAR